MRRLVNWNTYAADSNPIGEVNTDPSVTVPDQAISLKELLNRFVRDGAATVRSDGAYTGEEDDLLPDDFERMDVLDRLDYSRELGQGISDAQTRLAARNDERRRKKAKPNEEPRETSAPKSADPTPPDPAADRVKGPV